MTRLLPSNPRLRTVALWAAAIVALLAFTQLGISGRGGDRGTPAAVMFAGLAQGASAAITAAGLVLIYRTLRVINFAQAAMGVAGALLTFEFLQFTEVPFPIALLLGVLLSALIGTTVGVLTLRFFSSARLFLTVVLIVAAGVIGGFSGEVQKLPFFPPLDERTTATLSEGQDARLLLPFSGLEFNVGSFPLPFGFPELFALELAVVALLGLWAFLRFTKVGVAMRALAENTERASLLGVGVGSMAVLVWTIAGALAGMGIIATAAVTSPGAATGSGFPFLLPALAAGVLGRMASFPVAIGGAVMIAILENAWDFSYQDKTALFDGVVFLVLTTALAVQYQRGRSERGGGVSWSATDESRPIPHVLRSLSIIRITRVALISVGVIAVLVYPFLVSTGNVSLGGVIALNAVAVVSLVVLTGWAGQVSLAQYAFVAIGAVVGGSIIESTPIPFWFAVPLGAAFAGLFAMLVGLPALRIHGLFLLPVTFALAVVVENILFDERWFDWLLPQSVERPTLFILDFENERAMYYLCVATLVVAIVVVSNLRRSRIGRTLIGLRDNEANARSFGISAVRMKLIAFGTSGALCGMAGVVLAAHGRAVSADTFSAQASIDTFTAAVFGGVSSPLGALLGAAFFTAIGDWFADSVLLQTFLARGGTLFILMAAPGGIISLVNGVRDSVLRVVAQRRQIVVPSLFADYDEDAAERRLIPLAESDTSSGLSALPSNARYALESELYEGRGERIVDKLKGERAARDTVAMAAAAKSADEVETGAPA